MYPYLCQHHLKCKRCLVKGLACGPYEYAEETTDYLQCQPQRSIIPAQFPQTLPGHGVGVAQSPYLGGASQGDGVSAALPESQDSAHNILGDDGLPAVSFDAQDPSHNASMSTDPLMLFPDDAHLRTPPTDHSRSQANRSEEQELERISP